LVPDRGSSRDSGLESDRNNRPTAAQRLHLLNSSHVRRKFDTSPKFRALLQSGARKPETVTELYLTILSRLPTEEELQAFEAHARGGGDGVRDLLWALINSPEFSYRH
jgi:hypothetical protein